jgi:3-deoxy-7-phosphoheptulonate synthase
MQSTNSWSKSSWRNFPVRQQPSWCDSKELEGVLKRVERLPALVFAGESRALIAELAKAAEGKAFVLQAGDCAEDFSRCHGPTIHNLIKVILQMALILTYAGEKSVIKIGRIAGQYAKPRSSETEVVGELSLPSYRGDMVNSPEPNLDARTPDPTRIQEGYFRAAATLNLVRAFTTGGYAALHYAQAWSEASYSNFPANSKYAELVRGLKKTINFMNAIGLNSDALQLNQVSFYTSHEALLLEYEEAMTRIDTTTGKWYDSSAHMLWIGDRTRQLNGAHVEFLRGVCNPIGMKIGPDYQIDEIIAIADLLNPENIPGRLSFITRFGADKIETLLPPLVSRIKEKDCRVVWICDPMHGNTYANANNQKTRKYEDIMSEVKSFWQIHQSMGTAPGGVHLELTGDHVTECSGGASGVSEDCLDMNYLTTCDPRLNAEQAVEFAFELAGIIAK